ncbi:2',3'-cyclic-nucleotide 3'-phosphodiesterase [Ascoidea rubescens DSM 1968]|uniref:2',3'-cyclic-nucleotide 3'-phosphodiesterase n=1 Tax=Ascoidea rubescens DSM 1968 TaxID=1344418 RepID=A0A1D2VDD4_9ASCO|nr:2,3 cyclic phosphodiesterase [Ascoidea rubescens DSM 1968]ODV59651.1 2,3 cyclic phosphodiesterase [Ascoidea rubescens DSM 1968]
MAIALWFVPKKSSQLYDVLSNLIISLQPLFDDFPPIFEPHITITSNLFISSNSDINKILNASLIAFNTIDSNNSTINDQISLNNLNNLNNLIQFDKFAVGRNYFNKIHFQIFKNPNLISFARIIRELFTLSLSRNSSRSKSINNHSSHFSISSSSSNKYNNSTFNYGYDLDAIIPPNAKPPSVILNENDLTLKAKKIAEDWSTNQFNPHLSLVYSNIYKLNSSLIRTIKIRIEDSLDIYNLNENNLINYPNLGWNYGTLKIVNCEGNVQDWQVLGSIDFHK